MRWASRLDAFSGYPIQAWLISDALGRTTDTPEACSSRSSRTRDESSQTSNAHVLSAPPAFVLSQDQTLREGIDCLRRGKTVLPSSLCSKATSAATEVTGRTRRGCISARPPRRRVAGETCLSRRSTLLSFQRPSHWTVATKRPLTRTRGPRKVDTEVVSARSKALRSSSDRVLVAARLGRLEDGSRPSRGVNDSG